MHKRKEYYIISFAKKIITCPSKCYYKSKSLWQHFSSNYTVQIVQKNATKRKEKIYYKRLNHSTSYKESMKSDILQKKKGGEG